MRGQSVYKYHLRSATPLLGICLFDHTIFQIESDLYQDYPLFARCHLLTGMAIALDSKLGPKEEFPIVSNLQQCS